MKYKYKKLIFHFKMDFPGNDTYRSIYKQKKKSEIEIVSFVLEKTTRYLLVIWI